MECLGPESYNLTALLLSQALPKQNSVIRCHFLYLSISSKKPKALTEISATCAMFLWLTNDEAWLKLRKMGVRRRLTVSKLLNKVMPRWAGCPLGNQPDPIVAVLAACAQAHGSLISILLTVLMMEFILPVLVTLIRLTISTLKCRNSFYL